MAKHEMKKNKNGTLEEEEEILPARTRKNAELEKRKIMNLSAKIYSRPLKSYLSTIIFCMRYADAVELAHICICILYSIYVLYIDNHFTEPRKPIQRNYSHFPFHSIGSICQRDAFAALDASQTLLLIYINLFDNILE